MAQILVRDLDERVVARLKERAKASHRSLQGEVRAILEREARPRNARGDDHAREMADMASWARLLGQHGDDREDRDSR